MNKSSWAFRFLLLLLITTVFASACAANEEGAPAATEDPIFIGIAAARTGFMGVWDTEQVRAFQIALDEINADGGILDRPVNIEWIDTKTDQATSANVGRELLDEGADLLLVTCDFDYGAPAAVEAQKDGKVAISFCAGDVKMADGTLGPNAFTFGSGGQDQGAAGAEWAYKNGWRRVYILTDEALDVMKLVSRYFKARFEELGGEVIGEDKFVGGETVNVDTQITRMRRVANSVDFIHVVSFLPGGGSVIRSIRQAGIDTPLFHAGVSIYGPVLTEIAGPVSDYWTMPFACVVDCEGQPNPRLDEFMENYEERYGGPPETAAHPILAYDLAYLLKDAIERAGSVEADALTEALEQTRMELPLEGLVEMSPECHTSIRRALAVIEYQQGKAEFVEQYRAEQVPDLGEDNPCVGI